MTIKETLAALRAAGTAQNRKIYGRHGVKGEMFGVSFANQKALAKRIKTDQALAERLWASGNHDARILATMVADPAALSSARLDAWAKDLDSYVLTDAFTALVARTPHAEAKMKKWCAMKGEWLGHAGWQLLSHMALTDAALGERDLAAKLAIIEKEIHGRRNRVRHAMNGALISIGLRSPALQAMALAAAQRIGKVEVDHGETSCTTPDAASYILKAAARAKAKAGQPAAKRAAKAGEKPAAKKTNESAKKTAGKATKKPARRRA